MSVDRAARDDLQQAIIGFMRGDIRSREFQQRIQPLQIESTTGDYSIAPLATALAPLVDRFGGDHPLSASDWTWQWLRRVVAFLRSDLELQQSSTTEALPFVDAREWRQHEPLLQDCGIPEYNPRVHAQAIRSWDWIPSWLGLLIIFGLLAIFVAVVAFS